MISRLEILEAMWPGLYLLEAGTMEVENNGGHCHKNEDRDHPLDEEGRGHPLEEEVRGQRLDQTEVALLQQIIIARTGEAGRLTACQYNIGVPNQFYLTLMFLWFSKVLSHKIRLFWRLF